MQKLINFMEKYFVPLASRIGSQRHMVAIRDGFISIIPLVIIGSLAILVNNFPIKAYQDYMSSLFGHSWTSFAVYLYNGTFAIISLLIVFSISHNLARSYQAEPLPAELVSLIALIILLLQPTNGSFAIPFDWLDASGLFVAIFVAIISTEIMVRLRQFLKFDRKGPIRMAPILSRSFATLLPMLVVLSLFSILKLVFLSLGITNILEALYNLIQSPLAGMANTLGTAITIVFLAHLCWFLGIHGTNILEPVIQAMYLPALQENMLALARGEVIPNVFTKPFFDSFVYMGGCGTTISLLLALFIFSKRTRWRALVKLTFAQGMFNINEPVVYGLPIVINPLFIIPFIMTPIVLTITSYSATIIGLVPRTVAMVPWTTPPIISGFLVSGSIMGSALQLVNIVIGALLYLPFIIMAERMEMAKFRSDKGENSGGDRTNDFHNNNI